jgi:membrane protein required for colicin V production
MTPVDWVIVLICAVSAAFGVWRGFVKESLALATLLAAIWLAWRFSWVVEPWLGDWQGAAEARLWTARVVVFVLVLVVGAAVAWLARALIRGSGLTGVDRLLGGLFGLARGALLVGLGVIVLEIADLDQDAWWQSARLKPHADRIAAGIRYYAELGGRYLDETEAVQVDAL